MFDTPYIVAALAGEDRRLMGFEKGMQALTDGLVNKLIYNPDFTQAKDAIRWALDLVFDKAHTAIINAQHAKAFEFFIDYNYWDFNSSFDSVGVAKQYRTLTKKFPKWAPGKQVEAHQVGLNVIYRYMDILSEAVQVANLFKEIKPFIVKGRKPAVLTDAQRAKQDADLKNTGICPICFRRQKLDFNGNMVAHGYTLPHEWGGRNGMCFGQGHKAFELSNEGTLAYVEYLKGVVGRTKETLNRFETSAYPDLSETRKIREGWNNYRTETHTYEKGTPDYERLRKVRISENQRDINILNGSIKEYKERAAAWKEEPLKYGGAETQERWKSKLLNKQ